MGELCFSVEDPVPLHCDNKGAVDLTVNPVTGRRSKHIPIRHHVIREYVERGDITLIHTPTLEMLADGFTKSLPKATLMHHAYDMGQVLPGCSDDAPSCPCCEHRPLGKHFKRHVTVGITPDRFWRVTSHLTGDRNTLTNTRYSGTPKSCNHNDTT